MIALRDVTWGAVCVALGLVVPVLFHAVGLGATFLPMLLPLLAAGLLLPALPAALAGMITPLLSSFLTGMPPMAPPIALVMAVEGAVMAAVASLLHRRRGWDVYRAAVAAVALERAAMVLLVMALAPLFGLPGRLAALGTLVQGLPGVVLLLTVVPFLVGRLEKRGADHGRL